MEMKYWDKMMTPMKKVWAKISKKIGLGKNAGHVKLQQDVRTCEYEDVQVLWELLKRNEVDSSESGSGRNTRSNGTWFNGLTTPHFSFALLLFN